jgi:Mg2+/Co2+ transporter CorC
MENMKVRDLMIPTEKFPRISESATFYEGLRALEAAQERYLSGESEQRILLVEDADGKVIGKLSPIDLIRGLETTYNRLDTQNILQRFGLGYIWKSMQEDYHLWENPFRDLCRKAADLHIRDFFRPPEKGQRVHADDGLARCFHLFVMNRHDALVVFDGDDIIGLLRFSDVYQKAAQTMKECQI